MLDVKELTFAYPGSAKGVLALRGVSCTLREGSFTCVAGANGSGKSTLLTLLAGLFTPRGGEITCQGRPIGQKALRETCALMLQEAELQVLGATVGEDLLLSVARKDVSGQERAKELAARLHLDALWDTPVHVLSHGQKRKLCLANALLRRPKVLLLDEPLSGLDYPGLQELRALLQAQQQAGYTLVVSTHDLDPLADLADTLLVMDKGQSVMQGTPEDVLPAISNYSVRPPCSWVFSQSIRPWS